MRLADLGEREWRRAVRVSLKVDKVNKEIVRLTLARSKAAKKRFGDKEKRAQQVSDIEKSIELKSRVRDDLETELRSVLG